MHLILYKLTHMASSTQFNQECKHLNLSPLCALKLILQMPALTSVNCNADKSCSSNAMPTGGETADFG